MRRVMAVTRRVAVEARKAMTDHQWESRRRNPNSWEISIFKDVETFCFNFCQVG
jgi:hypothetical protein